MADDAPEPAANPASPAPSQDRTNEKPPTIQVPHPPERDTNDPLDPGRLASQELTVRQVLQEADRVIRIARPNVYGEYHDLIGQVGGYMDVYKNYGAWGEYDFKRANLYMRDLADLKLPGIDGLKARDDARKAVGESWRVWCSVYTTFKALAQRYAILTRSKEDLIAGVTPPPSNPPELV